MVNKKLSILLSLFLLLLVTLTGCQYSIESSVYPENSGSLEVVEKTQENGKDVVKAKAIAEDGWVFNHWEGQVSGTNPVIEEVIDSNMRVTAVFRKDDELNLDIGEVGESQTANYNWFYYIPESFNKVKKGYIFMNMSYHTPKSNYDFVSYYAKDIPWPDIDFAEKNNLILLNIALPRKDHEYYAKKLLKTNMSNDAPDFHYRPDLKVNMILDLFLEKLEKEDYSIDPKILVNGFSSGGIWANRYTILHPDRIKAAVIGHSGGWLTMPMNTYRSTSLDWPHGLNNYEEIAGKKYNKFDELKSTPMLVYIGSEDTEHTNYYGEEDINYFELWGDVAPEILEAQTDCLKKEGYNVEFKLFPGLKHATTSRTILYKKDFLLKNLD